jgi:LSD1 subclass zinc finger protein
VLCVFLKCHGCGHIHRIDEVRPKRVPLALFRGSEKKMKCKSCQAGMDTMLAFIGEQIGSEIRRRDDPKWGK